MVEDKVKDKVERIDIQIVIWIKVGEKAWLQNRLEGYLYIKSYF